MSTFADYGEWHDAWRYGSIGDGTDEGWRTAAHLFNHTPVAAKCGEWGGDCGWTLDHTTSTAFLALGMTFAACLTALMVFGTCWCIYALGRGE